MRAPYYPDYNISNGYFDSEGRLIEITTILRKQDSKGVWKDIFMKTKHAYEAGYYEKAMLEALREFHYSAYWSLIMTKVDADISLSDGEKLYQTSVEQITEAERYGRILGREETV